MMNTAFDWQIDEFMIYCRSRQLREWFVFHSTHLVNPDIIID